jgi:VIT1/CCC1 family predicted Fe2+/Mn2+ transporter
VEDTEAKNSPEKSTEQKDLNTSSFGNAICAFLIAAFGYLFPAYLGDSGHVLLTAAAYVIASVFLLFAIALLISALIESREV